MGAQKFILTGTSALRKAKNSKKFCQKVNQQTGYKIKILTPQEEAKITLKAVRHSLRGSYTNEIIADIGGGSTEVIIKKISKKPNMLSLSLGAVYLTEKFGHDLSAMKIYINREINRQVSEKQKKMKLICVGGTVTTLGAVLQKIKRYDPQKVHGYTVTLKQLNRTINKFSSLRIPQRKRLLPFAPQRADIFVAGLIILQSLMERFQTKKFTISDRGLLYGLALT